MAANSYNTPTANDTTKSPHRPAPLILKHSIYFFVPAMMLVVPFIAGTVSIWQLPLFTIIGYLMVFGGEKFGTWLFSPTRSWRQKIIRWCLYSIPVTVWAVMKMYSAFGIAASVATALAVIPGVFLIMFYDRPTKDGPANY